MAYHCLPLVTSFNSDSHDIHPTILKENLILSTNIRTFVLFQQTILLLYRSQHLQLTLPRLAAQTQLFGYSIDPILLTLYLDLQVTSPEVEPPPCVNGQLLARLDHTWLLFLGPLMWN